MPQASDEVIFITFILGIAIFILVALLVATVAILRSGAQMGKERSSTSLAEDLSAPLPKDELREESILSSPESEDVIPFSKESLKNTFKLNQRAINLLSVPIMAALMMGLLLVLVLVNPTDKFYADMALEPWLWSMLRIFVGIAGGGAIGIRIAQLSWRQTVLAALLASAGAMLISRFEISPFGIPPFNFDPGDFSEGNVQLYTFFIGTLAVSAPVFLLPLCDPLLRQSGLAPFREKVVFAALVITGMVVLILPFVGEVFMGFTCILLGIGVILSLYRPMETAGAELGGLGLVLLPISSFIWLSYASGSFS